MKQLQKKTLLLILLCGCLLLAPACGENVNYLKKATVLGQKIGVCEISKGEIGLQLRQAGSTAPYFLRFRYPQPAEEKFVILDHYEALEHRLFRVTLYSAVFGSERPLTLFFYLDETNRPVCACVCKGKYYMVDLDGDGDSEIVDEDRTLIEAGIYRTRVFDWRDGAVMVTDLVDSAKRTWHRPERTLANISPELPEPVGGFPEASVFPESGEKMSFRADFWVPGGGTSGLPIYFRDIYEQDWKPFKVEEFLPAASAYT